MADEIIYVDIIDEEEIVEVAVRSEIPEVILPDNIALKDAENEFTESQILDIDKGIIFKVDEDTKITVNKEGEGIKIHYLRTPEFGFPVSSTMTLNKSIQFSDSGGNGGGDIGSEANPFSSLYLSENIFANSLNASALSNFRTNGSDQITVGAIEGSHYIVGRSTVSGRLSFRGTQSNAEGYNFGGTLGVLAEKFLTAENDGTKALFSNGDVSVAMRQNLTGTTSEADKFWYGTQAEFDNLGILDAKCVYNIKVD